MKAALLQEFGGPEVIQITGVPDPPPGPGQILVDVKACALNIWTSGAALLRFFRVPSSPAATSPASSPDSAPA